MFTLLQHHDSRGTLQVSVHMDAALADLDDPTPDAKALLKEAKISKRKVGFIWRSPGLQTFFTYCAETAGQHEVSLIAALAVPNSDIYVTAGGSSEQVY